MKSEKYLAFTGTQISYFFVCQRKLWLFSHQIKMEQNSELVELGRLIHENSYKKEKKEILMGPVKIDFIGRNGVVHEVKKTPSVEDAHIWQLKYYLFYLKNMGIDNVKGMLNYPKLKKTMDIELTVDDEIRLLEILNEIKLIIEQDFVPAANDKKFCKKCSYYDLCYI